MSTAETNEKKPKSLLDDVLRVAGADGHPHLLVSCCDECGARAFPARERCARCCGQKRSLQEAPAEGTLYTYTVVRELGKQREGFVAYALGQIDLADDLRVIGIIMGSPESVEIGMRLRTSLLPQGNDEEGSPLVGYGFAPVAD
jgi:uncharacterized OB-fold protein